MEEILFRADFGKKTGWGHLIRCSALAQAAKENDLKTTLITQGDTHTLPEEAINAFDGKISIHQITPSIKEFGSLIQENKKQALVIDHYSFQKEHFKTLKQNFPALRLIQIQDFPEKLSAASDLAILPGFAGEGKKLPQNCLGGLEYTLIRSAFTSEKRAAPSTPYKVLILLGGTDATNQTETVIEALQKQTNGEIELYIISPQEHLIQKFVDHFSSITLRGQLSSAEIAEMYKRCDYAITSCGTSTYEMAACKLPFIGICVADNQIQTANAIEANWNLPIIKKLNPDTFAKAWEKLLKNKHHFPAKLNTQGPKKVINALFSL